MPARDDPIIMILYISLPPMANTNTLHPPNNTQSKT